MRFVRKIPFFLFLPSISTARNDLVVLSLNKIQFADQFSGTDACMRIQNAIAALPVNGGEVDARGFLGFFIRSARLQRFLGTEPASERTCYRSNQRSSLHRWSLMDHNALHFVLGRRVCWLTLATARTIFAPSCRSFHPIDH
jgi:hypothetical protein